MTSWGDVLTPAVEYGRLLWCDAAGMRRCRVIPRHKLEQTVLQGVGLAYACFWLPAWGDCCLEDEPAAVPVGEMRLVPDFSAARVLPWMPSHATVLVTMCTQPPSNAWGCCPRSALKRVLVQAVEQHGLTFRLGFELEFHLLHKPQPGTSGGGNGGGGGSSSGLPLPIDSGNYCSSSALDGAATVLDEMCSALASLGIPVDQLHPESGPGQFELATGHAPALAAVDGLLFSREAVAAVASRHSMVASFLPKLWAGSAASGLHCHFSVWQGEVNLLEHQAPAAAAAAGGGVATAAAAAPAAVPLPASASSGGGGVAGLSPVGEAFMAGVLRHLPALLCFSTPSPNSYRRMQPHCWTGAYQCYGVNNREAPLRLCATPGAPQAANCELKAFDGTANPHLAVAAMIVAGLQGVRQGLRLPPPVDLDPGTLSDAQRQAAGIQRLPATLGEALEAFKADTELHAALDAAFGTETLVRAFLAVRRSEWQHFRDMPLDQEAALLYGRY